MRFSRASSVETVSLENTAWRWQESENSQEKVTVDKPENYEIQFNANGELGAKADCNGGGAKYQAENGKLTISPLIRTQIFCGEDSLDKRFVQGLEKARTYRVEGNFLFIESANDNDKMKFFRVTKQN
ncbi:MAG: META domain-containing protein, partial [Acidobacteriota bacterium]